MEPGRLAESVTYERLATASSWSRHIATIEQGLVDRAADRFPAPGAMLDIGCEGGRWALQFHRRGWRVRGTDIKLEPLELARQRMPDGEFTLVTVEDSKLPVPTDEVDVITCMEVPVVNAPWYPTEVARVLRPGGVIAGTMWNRTSYRGKLLGDRPSGKDWYIHDYRQWRSTMVEAGFSFAHERGFYWAPFSRRSETAIAGTVGRVEAALAIGRLVRYSPWIGFVAQRSG